MQIQEITSPSFRKYGTVLEGYDFNGLVKEMKHAPVPQDEVIYIPSMKELELLPIAAEFKNRAFGGLPIQLGFCNGYNRYLNAVEYHRSSELNIAVTDMILILGMQQDIEPDFTYETSRLEAFILRAGTGVQLYATTLHYAPVSVNDGCFQCVVVLPKDTNTDLDSIPAGNGEDNLLTAKNKWLIAHEDAKIEGAFCGLKGENIKL